MRLCFTYDFQALVKMTDEFQSGGKEFQKGLLNTGSKVMRDALIHGFGVSELERIPDAEKDFVANFSKVFNAEKVAEVIPKIEEANYHIERNANPKILFLEITDPFAAQPAVKQHRRRFSDRIKQKPINPDQGYKLDPKPECMSGKIGLRQNFPKNRDTESREEKCTDSHQNRIRKKG